MPPRDGPVALRDMRVLAVCGSLKGRSRNRALLTAAAASMPPGVDVVFFDGLGDLPHFNPDLEDLPGCRDIPCDASLPPVWNRR